MPAERALVNPEILIWAREQTGLDLEAAARKIGTVPRSLEAWESGVRHPSLTQARAVARVYHRPLAALYLRRRPEPDHLPHDFRRLALEDLAPPSAELRQAVRRANLKRQAAMQLAADQAPSYGWIGVARDITDPSDLGRSLRGLVGVDVEQQKEWARLARQRPHDLLNHWKAAVEQLGVLVFHFSRVPVEEARGFSLLGSPYPVVALNGADSPNGRIFTLFHELAHLHIGVEGACNLGEGDHSANGRMEARCNGAAGEGLVPLGALASEDIVEGRRPGLEWQDHELVGLARTYGVSREVILRRLLTLHLTTNEFYLRKRDEWSAAQQPRGGGPISRARLAVRDSGQRFTRIVLDAYSAGTLTATDISEYLGVRLKHLPAIADLIEGPALLTGRER